VDEKDAEVANYKWINDHVRTEKSELKTKIEYGQDAIKVRNDYTASDVHAYARAVMLLKTDTQPTEPIVCTLVGSTS
jgi:hypothetical protein